MALQLPTPRLADLGRTVAGRRRRDQAAPGAPARCLEMESREAGRSEASGAVGTQHRGRLDCATLGFDLASGLFEFAGGGAQRPDAALCDRAERRILRAADGWERHARRVAVGLDR